MRRTTSLFACMALCLALSACNAATGITNQDISGKPTVYSVVKKAPDARLLGCFMRPRPPEYKRPNTYQFCLIKDGDKYAMYYYILDGKSLATYKGWSPSLIDGDSITSGYDGSRYFLKDDVMWQTTTVGGPHRMLPVQKKQ